LFNNNNNMGTAIKYPVSDQVKPSLVIVDIQALCPECQSAQMSKITNDPIWSINQSINISLLRPL